MLVGHMIAGGSLSLTVTVKLHVAVLPAASVTRNTLVVTPTGKADPLANPPVCVFTSPTQLPHTTASVYCTSALCTSDPTLATMFDGQLITGGSLSLTVTVKLHVAVLPARSEERRVGKECRTRRAESLEKKQVCVVTAPEQLTVPTGAL